ncbi:helix-turn-helix domain-containing protein, partial [Mycobacteroides abscessus]|uniref:helix-turn-helix domain-containing protein n=1 Tax=Mycobacteroides abscessus TaxID=36809 RepID=UPI001A959797
MTTLMAVDGDRGETRAAAVARRVREELAGKRIRYNELARAIGKSPQAISRRISGEIPWDVDELDRACESTGISYAYVTAGIRPVPDGGPGGSSPRPGLPLPDGATQGNRTPDLFIT